MAVAANVIAFVAILGAFWQVTRAMIAIQEFILDLENPRYCEECRARTSGRHYMCEADIRARRKSISRALPQARVLRG